ncbi:recombinase family protein [Kurthia sibirica]|uniref:recombinase family protein n=1 Tax=Kurthia sibirica TaxID=202750 RepID=UPI0011730EF6|nr:recombinase family protein [Kurthia sibirica]GEK35452.1 resolvase [Kurthia sibirica]
MRYGYARVSTHGQDLTTQIEQLERENCDEIFSEHYTGTKKDRPKFTELLNKVQEGDIIVVTKLDRFARSTMGALSTIEALNEKNVDLVVIDMGGQKIDTSTPNGELLFTIMSGFAKFERDMIVQRTQEGKAYAKANNPNFKEGRPIKHKKAQRDSAIEYLRQGLSYKEAAEKTGMSKATVYREAAKRGMTKQDMESKGLLK